MVKLKYYFQRPEKGYDPVPAAFAAKYADNEYQKLDNDVVDKICGQLGALENRTLLDLGGGPGQFSLAFAQRGAQVTWHDISQNYLKIAREKAKNNKVKINFSLGYLEEAKGKFDVLFNRICWYYCLNDKQFAHQIYDLLNVGGKGLIIVNNEDFLNKELQVERPLKKLIIKFSFWLNEKLGIKLTHVHPSHQKLKNIFSKLKFQNLNIERNGHNTLITFNK